MSDDNSSPRPVGQAFQPDRPAGKPDLLGAPPGPGPKKVSRFNQIKPYLAPMLITVILVVADVNYRVLQSYWLTALAIGSAILLEIVLSYVATGRFPHLASAYITGISVGILVHTPEWWPFAVCSLLSISSKYALRLGGRHLWNPSNFGVSVLLLLVPAAMAPLADQFGNDIWPSIIILTLGSIILFTLGRLHITVTFAAAFIALAPVRAWLTGTNWLNELTLLTFPSYQLFMIFMITDPKTTTRTWQRQCAVVVLVAVVEALLRLSREVHAPYYALFIVAPITNLLEIWWDGRKQRASAVAAPQRSEGPSLVEPLK